MPLSRQLDDDSTEKSDVSREKFDQRRFCPPAALTIAAQTIGSFCALRQFAAYSVCACHSMQCYTICLGSRLLALLTLSLLRLRPVVGDAYICNLSIVGNSSYPSNLTFVEVSIGCTPVPPTDFSAKLSLLVDQSLVPYSAAFAGEEHRRVRS